ncbi:hypothetical protein [Phenylobacterium sp.]|jgi:hypothetical protein|uniref:hypothetical protein n=1 Tax=Phenylobacterium sp. TaxID=1871053 RepID=UPI002F94FD64
MSALLAETAAPTALGRFAVSPAVRRIELGAAAALFSERAQQLYGLNPTADAIWQALAAGVAAEDIAADLGPQGAEYVDACLQPWLAAGFLVPADLVTGAPTSEHHLSIAGLACRIAIHGHLDLSAFAQFAAPAAEAPLQLTAVEHPLGWFLLVGDAPRGLFPPNRIVSELKAVLTDELTRAVGGGAFLIHAGLLAHERRGLLVSGHPGAGKTTLTLALAARGFGYGSDDIVRVDAGRLEGVPFSPASKSGAWDLAAPYVPVVRDLPVHLRGDGQQVRYVPTAGFEAGDVDSLGWVLLLDRRAGARPVLEPVPPMAVLTELLASAFAADHRLSADALEAFAAQLAAADCRRLVYSDLAEAVAAIEALVSSPA